MVDFVAILYAVGRLRGRVVRHGKVCTRWGKGKGERKRGEGEPRKCQWQAASPNEQLTFERGPGFNLLIPLSAASDVVFTYVHSTY
jgi:hypothetical protein